MVVIDSLNGYLQAMSSDRSFVLHLHELLAYLNAKGVITILVSAQHGFVNADQSSFEATYLADLVILLRYFEAQGQFARPYRLSRIEAMTTSGRFGSLR